MGLLKVLIVAILVLWVIRAVGTVVFPWFLRYLGTKMQGEANKQYHNKQQQPYSKEGEIRVDYIPPKKSKKMVSSKAGEFVDFEDVKK